MTTFDAHANLAVATVSPDSTVIGSTLGDTILAESLEAAAIFPAVPFNVTVWRDAAPEPGAAEIMRVTAFDGTRTFTVERGQEGTAPLAFIAIGWRFANTITAGDVEAIEDAVNAEESARAAAIASEAATRASADSTLQGEVTAETAARIAGDASTLSAAEAYTVGAVGAEATARAAADATLQGNIDSEATARAAGDAATLSSAESYADGQVAAEAVLRASGDAATLATAEAYTDSKVVAAVHYRGAIDASTNPNLPAANLGDLYAISVAGTVSGIAVEAGDMAICKVNATPANTPANWDVVQTNITGAVTGPAISTDQHFAQFNGTTGKVIQDGGLSLDTDPTLAADSNARVASQKATKDYADGVVGTEATARAAAVTAEAAARSAADAVLQGEVDAKQPIMTTTTVKNSAYAAGLNEIVPCDSTAAAFAVTLPNAPVDGTRVTVKLILSAATLNNVTVQAQGSDVFNKAGGPTTATLQLLNEAQTYQYDHARAVWTVLSDDFPVSGGDARYVRQGVGLAPSIALLGALDVQVFRATGTWTKPAGAKYVTAICVGPGGGGGGGIIGATSISGGAGGGGGGVASVEMAAADLAGTVAVVVGTGGIGGAGVATGAGTGNVGQPGSGASTFGTILSAGAGLGGGAGNNADSVGGAGGTSTRTNPSGLNLTNKVPSGTAGGGCVASTGAPTGGTNGTNQATGGGAGNGVSAIGNGGNGSSGGAIALGQVLAQGGGPGNGSTTPVARAGIGGMLMFTAPSIGGGGGGGGGCANAGAGSPTSGGDGGPPGGGGGGGGSGTSGTAGSGGNGGDGLVIVICW